MIRIHKFSNQSIILLKETLVNLGGGITVPETCFAMFRLGSPTAVVSFQKLFSIGEEFPDHMFWISQNPIGTKDFPDMHVAKASPSFYKEIQRRVAAKGGTPTPAASTPATPVQPVQPVTPPATPAQPQIEHSAPPSNDPYKIA